MNNRLASFALLSLSVFAAPGLSASETATVTPLWDKVDKSAVIPAEIYIMYLRRSLGRGKLSYT